RELLQLADIATPHIAGYSADGKWTATKMSLENLKEFFNLEIEEARYQEIPSPINPIIDLQDIAPEQQLQQAVWHTYNPAAESNALKESPEKFYWLRSNYPLRREYPAYTVIDVAAPMSPLLLNLGFKVK
ncbi:MAG: DUF3410 domain-containing protein, partial [Bacteroidales bacterium]|nr:DUF3410 domain-containing protein [Bacteroidales bacterium]